MLMFLKFYKAAIFIIISMIQDFYKILGSFLRIFAKECKFLATKFQKISL
jgi:hypothetical protein